MKRMRACLLALLLAGCAAPHVATVPPSPAVAIAAAPRMIPSNPQQNGGLQLADPEVSRELHLLLERTLAEDSRSWLFNRYDVGSVTTRIAVKKDDARHALFVIGGYTVNQGKRMMAIVALQNGRIVCIATSDFPGVCRPVGQPPSHQIARALAQGNGQPHPGGGRASELPGGCYDAESRHAGEVALDSSCGFGDLMSSINAEDNRERENRDAVQEGRDLPHPNSEVAPED